MRTTNPPEQAARNVAALASLRRRLPPPAMRKALRKGSGLTLAQVATSIGDVTPQAIGLWESGKRTPRKDLLGAYVAVLEQLADDSSRAAS